MVSYRAGLKKKNCTGMHSRDTSENWREKENLKNKTNKQKKPGRARILETPNFSLLGWWSSLYYNTPVIT